MRPAGRIEWTSRAHRKRGAGRIARARRPGAGERWWWAPRRLAWWIGVLFAAGSALFAAGAGVDLAGGDAAVAAVVYFSGSIFFTTAAAGQFAEALNAGRTSGGRRWAWAPRRADWLATAVQLVGTVLFNVNTALAIPQGLSARQEDALVWAPDAVGSACFLIASWVAWAEACGGRVRLRARGDVLEWRIGAANMAGSVLFAVSAAAALVLPSTGAALDDGLASLATLGGAIGFLAGALLLLPESVAAPPAAAGLASAAPAR
ncbi:MAG: hypothetical protein MUE51_04635 [Thermoleophilia bacterium]|nr:hypothetical protein [Thermoleophilia bacterium]